MSPHQTQARLAQSRVFRDKHLRPLVTLKWAQSVDGQLADDDQCSQWISGPEERQYTHWLRSVNDVVLVGAQTYLKDRCQLSVRDYPFDGVQPARVILDPKGRLLEALWAEPEMFGSSRKTYVVSGAAWPAGLSLEGPILWAQEAREEGEALDAWIPRALKCLERRFAEHEERPLSGVMVEGGPAMLTAFFKAGLADRVEIAVSPVVLGGSRNRVATDLRLRSQRLRHESSVAYGNDILFSYQGFS